MGNELRILLQLQGVSQEITQLERQLSLAQKRLVELKTFETKARNEVTHLEAQFAQIRKLSKDKESELQATEDKLSHLRKRASEVRTQKEYEAFEREIEILEKKRSQLEEEILSLMDKEDALLQKIAETKNKVAMELEETETERKRLESITQRNEALRAALLQDEQRFLASLPDNLSATYKSLIKRHGLPVVVEIKGESCSGCGTILPTGVIQQLRTKVEFTECPHCLRIIFAKSEEPHEKGE
jgi:predicted  nucleic acid-binding Zn-ribbon protein